MVFLLLPCPPQSILNTAIRTILLKSKSDHDLALLKPSGEHESWREDQGNRAMHHHLHVAQGSLAAVWNKELVLLASSGDEKYNV